MGWNYDDAMGVWQPPVSALTSASTPSQPLLPQLPFSRPTTGHVHQTGSTVAVAALLDHFPPPPRASPPKARPLTKPTAVGKPVSDVEVILQNMQTHTAVLKRFLYIVIVFEFSNPYNS
jgi:hypothetical protein